MINIYICIFLFAVFISSFSQIMLKKSADSKHKNVLKEYLNLRVIGAYVIFLISLFCSIYAYRGIPLSLGPVLEASQYIFVAVLSCLLLKEAISKRKLIGLVFIFFGIVVSSL